jgi:hypothetical protein
MSITISDSGSTPPFAPTPLTDAQPPVGFFNGEGMDETYEYISRDFARALEQQLAKCEAALKWYAACPSDRIADNARTALASLAKWRKEVGKEGGK